MQTIIEGLLSRHSVRKYTGDQIPDKDLELMIKAGMAAPTAVNVQPWAFILVTERDVLDNLCRVLPYAKMLDKAGAAVIVCGIPDKDAVYAKEYWMLDCAAASENILLAAHGLGYGAVWTAVYPEQDRMVNVRNVCAIPGNVMPFNVIPVGVPVNKDSAPLDKYKAANIHRNTW